jgi:hypothetical protein
MSNEASVQYSLDPLGEFSDQEIIGEEFESPSESEVQGSSPRPPAPHEIVPNPCFAAAARVLVYTDPLYLSVSVSDMAFTECQVWSAAVRDLKAMRAFLANTSIASHLDAAIAAFSAARASYPVEWQSAADEWLDQETAPSETGPKYAAAMKALKRKVQDL